MVDFYEFFKEFMPKLNNAYIFVMSDHGLRFGEFHNTHIGEIEDNNPGLFVVVPEKLRNNHQLMNTMRDNAKQLVSH